MPKVPAETEPYAGVRRQRVGPMSSEWRRVTRERRTIDQKVHRSGEGDGDLARVRISAKNIELQVRSNGYEHRSRRRSEPARSEVTPSAELRPTALKSMVAETPIDGQK